MKFLMKAVLSLVTVAALIIGLLFFYTGGMTSTANDFFTALKKKQHDKANSFLSKHIIDEAALLHQYLKVNSMGDVQSSSWDSRQFVNNKGSISGSSINSKKQTFYARIDFIKEDGDWKIYAIEKLDPTTSMKTSVPTTQKQQNLVKKSMSTFMGSAQQKSMKNFYAYISALWRSQVTVAQLDQAFGSIYNFQGDFSFLNPITPIIELALIDEHNLLVMTGYFPLNDFSIHFRQKYIYEISSWKLISFSYNREKVKSSE